MVGWTRSLFEAGKQGWRLQDPLLQFAFLFIVAHLDDRIELFRWGPANRYFWLSRSAVLSRAVAVGLRFVHLGRLDARGDDCFVAGGRERGSHRANGETRARPRGRGSTGGGANAPGR